ncbi:hypothetical protein SELMODRAFT_430317 [Selaginella moellendorffii]|uniref:Inositol polyphosphate-related phosphatase domain-containing protein n=1 Tax=Selaginella moellendorffii TaxID=88036 RepID=D8T908_SELML|nr:hypothetical protein SELMODRAFT_430317 [Selaginella moellendorffii]
MVQYLSQAGRQQSLEGMYTSISYWVCVFLHNSIINLMWFFEQWELEVKGIICWLGEFYLFKRFLHANERPLGCYAGLDCQIRVGVIEQDGSIRVNQSFTFDIKDPNNAVLLLHVVSKTRFGGEDSLGISTEVRVADLLVKKGGGQDGKTKWYDLSGKRLMPGKVLMDLDARIAEPEHDISVFLGTWNVGNARLAVDLSSWLITKSKHAELL